MEFLRRNINKQSRNGDIISSSISSSYIGGGTNNSGGGVSGNYLPATNDENGVYIVPHYVTFQESTTDAEGNEVLKNLLEITTSGIKVNGNILATGEVSAYGSGTTSGGSSNGGGSVTVYDGLDSEASDIALSANQGRVLKNLIDTLDIGDIDLSGYYSKTEIDTKLNEKSPTSHTHAISAVTNLQSTLDSKASSSHTHTEYASSSHTHAISAITNLQTSLDAKAANTALTAHTASTTVHITSAERTKWNDTYTNLNDWFYKDDKGYIHSKYYFIGDSEISAYGSGTTTSSSGSGSVTVYDGLDSTETEVALSANQGRVLKNLIDTLDIGDIDLSGYSKTSHTHSNYSLTSHTHSAYASSSHTHPISAVTNLQSTLDGKSSTSHTHSAYYDSSVSRTKNTVLAAPNGSAGTATFRALVAADIPSLAISKITNLQSSLDGKSSTSHTHNYTSTVKVGSTSYNVSANTISLPSYPTLTTLSGVSTTTFNTHSGNTTVHITSAERTKWNGVVTNWNNVFEIDSNGDLKVKVNLIGTKEISAYGSGTTTSSSGSGSVTVYDGLDSTETEVALSANQGRVLKNLIDTLDIGDIDLSGYSKTSHTHSNYSLTSHTHSGYASTSHTHTQYASSSHTHPISAVTNLQTTLNGKSSTSHTHSTYSLTSHTHSTYYDSAVSRTKNTVLAAPNGSAGTATFRALVAADIPSLAISKITNLQSTLDGKSSTSHTHSNYSLTSHTHSAYATTGHTHSSLTFSGGTFSAKTYNPSGATTVNIPTSTSHLTNNSGYITSAATVANSNKFSGYTMRSAATWVNNSVEAYIQYTIDATSLSTSNFYPIIFPTTQKDLYVRMYSTAGSSSAAYNQNKLEFTFRRTRMERYSTRFNSTFL